MKDFLKGVKGMQPMRGKGLKKLIYGKYTIDKKKLGRGVLSISYPNGHQVSYYLLVYMKIYEVLLSYHSQWL